MSIIAIFTILISALVFIIVWILNFEWSSENEKGDKKREKILNLKRFKKNPVMSPRGNHDWEIQGVFNPASVKIDGKTYLLYRAIGVDGVSKIGYAITEDGQNILERATYPIFAITSPRIEAGINKYHFDPVLYPSGGSWGGCEDPRAVLIDERVYMTFNAFDGWDFLRIGLTSISKEDLKNKKWNWAKPIFISPAGEVHKNWVLFPEKIGKKFAILHSINPEVQIEFVDDLRQLEKDKKIQSKFGQKTPRKDWDTWVRGAGAPPLRTKDGWLLFYHATNKKDPHKYKLGAMLLDLKNPTKILYRSPEAILEPDEWYENDWKPGVVYVCGAIINNDKVFVYYGGGDKHTCLAVSDLDELLKFIKGKKTSSKIFEKVK